MTREELVGIYAKKIEAEYGEEFVTMLFAERIKFILAELIAAVQGSINRDAPTSTATSEVIEKYARDLRMHNETRPLANTREKQEETLRAILTRFASEITVDAGKVWAELVFNKYIAIQAGITRIEALQSEITGLNKKYDDDMKEYGRRLQVVIDNKKEEITELRELCGAASLLIQEVGSVEIDGVIYSTLDIRSKLDRASKGDV